MKGGTRWAKQGLRKGEQKNKLVTIQNSNNWVENSFSHSLAIITFQLGLRKKLQITIYVGPRKLRPRFHSILWKFTGFRSQKYASETYFWLGFGGLSSASTA